jgi:glycerophosphoryl diester phosphodiesterase
MIAVSLAQTGLAWGWPNRFVQRMAANHVEILVIGGIDSIKSTGFWRVDSDRDLARLPVGVPAQVWTDHVEIVGPIMRRRAGG